MITIRPMCQEDIEEVAYIEKENFTLPWSYRLFSETIMRQDTIYIVACRENRILGYCGLHYVFDEAEITNVSVRKSEQSHGVGFKLLQELISLGKSRGVTTFILEVRQSNQSAINLYKKLDFEIQGIRRNFYQMPVEDAIIMSII